MFHASKRDLAVTDIVSLGYIHTGGKVCEISGRQDAIKEKVDGRV
jgi:hypothetical protein